MGSLVDRADLIRRLRELDVFAPGEEATVDVIETHASLVFLAGERAYKLKKAIKFPYLDFSTLALRLAAARNELACNRRFSPQLYLGLQGIYQTDNGPVLGPLLPGGDLEEMA